MRSTAVNKTLLTACAAVFSMGATGCAIFAPYDSKFQCERSRDFGKCTDVAGAYSDALGGVEDSGVGSRGNVRRREKSVEERAEPLGGDPGVARANITRYKAAEYGELASIIEQPITPVVAPPKLLRTLVVAYATPEKTLYLPRYVYYFVSEGNFLLGDYLNAEVPDGAAVMYPNGAR